MDALSEYGIHCHLHKLMQFKSMRKQVEVNETGEREREKVSEQDATLKSYHVVLIKDANFK